MSCRLDISFHQQTSIRRQLYLSCPLFTKGAITQAPTYGDGFGHKCIREQTQRRVGQVL